MESKRVKSQNLGWWWPPLCVAIGVLIYYMIITLKLNALPEPLMRLNENLKPDAFIAERAQNFTSILSNIGPKASGSVSNEVNAIGLLKAEMDHLISEANQVGSNYAIEYDVQVVSGTFPIGAITRVYKSIQNFVVRLTPKNTSTTTISSLLVNSHFDTVPVSYGAGDAIIMVGVMLEVIRVLSRDVAYPNAIVFLFNGAEENGLIAAHGFITQHKWAGDVKGLINLDSCGSGGREMLFQSSPKAPWFVEQYKRSVPHPFAIVTAQEMFEANLIPSDTDFRIFRDFGNISGVDLAIIDNGYVYHTKSDRVEIIPMGTYQHLGDNLLALVRQIAGSPDLSTVDKMVQDLSEAPIYFDFMGWFMISYSLKWAIVMNVLVVTAALLFIVIALFLYSSRSGATKLSVFGEFLVMIVAQLVTVALAVGVVIALAILYDAVGRSMSWFSSPWILFGIYLCPFFYILGQGPAMYLWFHRKCAAKRFNQLNKSYRVQMLLHAQCVLFGIIGIALTGLMIKSAYIVTMFVAFYTLSTIINVIGKIIHHDRIWLLTIWIGQVIPFMYLSYFAIIAMSVFIPIQGRGGSTDNPEIIIGMFCIFIGLLQGGLLVPGFCMCKRPMLVLLGFLVIFATFIIVMATPVGFPYRTNTSAQRFWIFHTERTYHNFDRSVRDSQSGYFMLGMDRHQNDFLGEFVPALLNVQSTSHECEKELFCGLPVYSAGMIWQSNISHWVPAEKPVFDKKSEILYLGEESESTRPNRRRYNFQAVGTDHMAVIISPIVGARIVSWSWSDRVVRYSYPWNGRLTYFVALAYSVDDSAHTFYIDIETSDPYLPKPAIDIALSAHYVHHDNLQTEEFKTFLASFPQWATLTPWMSYYENWQF